MNLRALITGLVLVLTSAHTTADHLVLTLYTFDSPPYQYATETPAGLQVIGETVETVRCAMDRAGVKTSIRLVPQNRARYSLERNLVNGYFPVDRSPELDQEGWLSYPVALEKWLWLYTGERPDPAQARIGVIGGSNEDVWLAQQGLKPFVSVASARQLPALLQRGRIDLALMDERVMNTLQQDEPGLGQSLQRAFLRYAPLHLYLNPHFVNEHQDILPQFNRHLPDCMTTHTQLSEEEHRLIATTAGRLIRELSQEINLSQAIHQGPIHDSFTDILTQDTVWQALAPEQQTPLAKQILELPASRALARWQAQHSPLVTEITLINNKGALAAISQPVSDYWQGDEPKFQEIAVETSKGIKRRADQWISPIHYDASTSQFQVTVSVPLSRQEPNNGLEGVLSLGLAIEQAIQSDQKPAQESD